MPRPRKYRPRRRRGLPVEPVKTYFAEPTSTRPEPTSTRRTKEQRRRARARGVDRFGRPLSRAEGTNPRALGINPRALGMSPRQLRDFCPLLREDEAKQVLDSLQDNYDRGQRREKEDALHRLLSPAQIANRNSTGLCRCGCGRLTPRATHSHRVKGWVKGEPLAYLRGHHLKHRLRGDGEPPGAAVSSLPLEPKAGKPFQRLTDDERREVERLYHDHRDTIRRLFKKSLDPTKTPKHFAEDLVQDTFVRVCESIHQRVHTNNIEAWLRAIAANVGKDYFKHAGRTKRNPASASS